MIEASRQRNVIPAQCVVTVDCRLLPGRRPKTWTRSCARHSGRATTSSSGTSATAARGRRSTTPLWTGWRAGWRDRARRPPGAVICPGFTDSHWLREAFGTVAYGFFPLKAMDGELASRLVHSADERIPVDDLELGVDAVRAAVISSNVMAERRGA